MEIKLRVKLFDLCAEVFEKRKPFTIVPAAVRQGLIILFQS
jgi:hypothetical protein